MSREKSVDEEVFERFKGLYTRPDGSYRSIYGRDVKEGQPCGESSPYQEWISAQRRDNPDISERRALELCEEKEKMLTSFAASLPKLTARQYQVVRMVVLEGKTLANTAAILGVSRGTVENILNQAKRKIKRSLTK